MSDETEINKEMASLVAINSGSSDDDATVLKMILWSKSSLIGKLKVLNVLLQSIIVAKLAICSKQLFEHW